MGKFVEIGALVEKQIGDGTYEKIYNLNGVEYVVLETGRSNDLFASRQFGEFGEAALMTVIAESSKKDQVLAQMYDILGVGEAGVGLICEDKPIEQMKTYFYVFLNPRSRLFIRIGNFYFCCSDTAQQKVDFFVLMGDL